MRTSSTRQLTTLLRFSEQEIRNKKDAAKSIVKIPFEDLRRLLALQVKCNVESRLKTLQTGQKLTKAANAICNTILNRNGAKFGVFLSGRAGCGKTTLAQALSDVCQVLWKKDLSTRCPVYDARDFRNAEILEEAKKRPLICIEDLGRETVVVNDFGTKISPIVDILESRYAERKFTLITSNIPPKDIAERYGERIADRLREMMEVVTLEDKSYR